MGKVEQGEKRRLAARCAAHRARLGYVPTVVTRGMGARWQRVEALEHHIHMLLGVFAAHGVLPLEYKPAYAVGDLLTRHLDELEAEVERRGGVQRVLDDHVAKVYRLRVPETALATHVT